MRLLISHMKYWTAFPEDEGLEQTAMQLCGYLPEGESALKFGESPSGIVQVYDTEINDWSPVRRAKVQVIHFGRLLTAETNDLGKFSISRRFYAGTQVNVLFCNSKSCIRAMNTTDFGGIITLPTVLAIPATHFDGWRSASNLDNMIIRFGSDNQVRLWAHIQNAVQDFYDFANQTGISTPPAGFNIYAHWNNNRRDGATLMFGHFNDPFSIRHQTLAWLSEINKVINVDILTAIGLRMPDVIIEYDAGDTIRSEELNHMVYHELGHTSHYNRVGVGFWATLVSAEAGNILTGNNPPYGTRGDATAPLIGMCEAWAETIADEFLLRRYNTGTEQERESPWLDEPVADRCIPYGIFYDMTDGIGADERGDQNTINRNRGLNFNDNVTGFSLRQINTILNMTVTTPQVFISQFQILYSSNNANLNALLNSYGQ